MQRCDLLRLAICTSVATDLLVVLFGAELTNDTPW